MDLQCCVSFRFTANWISYMYTYIHSFLDSFPIQAITEYWVEFPVLYSRSLIVIYFIYTSVYINPNLPTYWCRFWKQFGAPWPQDKFLAAWGFSGKNKSFLNPNGIASTPVHVIQTHTRPQETTCKKQHFYFLNLYLLFFDLKADPLAPKV